MRTLILPALLHFDQAPHAELVPAVELDRLERDLAADGALVIVDLRDDRKQRRRERRQQHVRQGGQTGQGENSDRAVPAATGIVAGRVELGPVRELRCGRDELGEPERGGERGALVVLLELQ